MKVVVISIFVREGRQKERERGIGIPLWICSEPAPCCCKALPIPSSQQSQKQATISVLQEGGRQAVEQLQERKETPCNIFLWFPTSQTTFVTTKRKEGSHEAGAQRQHHEVRGCVLTAEHLLHPNCLQVGKRGHRADTQGWVAILGDPGGSVSSNPWIQGSAFCPVAVSSKDIPSCSTRCCVLRCALGINVSCNCSRRHQAADTNLANSKIRVALADKWELLQIFCSCSALC